MKYLIIPILIFSIQTLAADEENCRPPQEIEVEIDPTSIECTPDDPWGEADIYMKLKKPVFGDFKHLSFNAHYYGGGCAKDAKLLKYQSMVEPIKFILKICTYPGIEWAFLTFPDWKPYDPVYLNASPWDEPKQESKPTSLF